MSAGAAQSTGSADAAGAWRNPAAWIDDGRYRSPILIALCAALVDLAGRRSSLSCWLIALVPTLDVAALPAFAEAADLRRCRSRCLRWRLVGTLWSDAAWGARLYAVSPTAKLLVLPVLFYHFERSARGMWVFVAFLVSCTLLMVMSWIVAFDPQPDAQAGDDAERGIFVKNYIDQSQEFALCAVALAYPIVTLLRARQNLAGGCCWSRSRSSFLVNMAFVVVSRTALVTMPIMLAVFALLHLRWRSIADYLCALAVAARRWRGWPRRNLRTTIDTFAQRLSAVQGSKTCRPRSGLRLEFWRKSLRFLCRGAGHRPWHRIDARAVRAGRDRAETGAAGRGDRQSA